MMTIKQDAHDWCEQDEENSNLCTNVIVNLFFIATTVSSLDVAQYDNYGAIIAFEIGM